MPQNSLRENVLFTNADFLVKKPSVTTLCVVSTPISLLVSPFTCSGISQRKHHGEAFDRARASGDFTVTSTNFLCVSLTFSQFEFPLLQQLMASGCILNCPHRRTQVSAQLLLSTLCGEGGSSSSTIPVVSKSQPECSLTGNIGLHQI